MTGETNIIRPLTSDEKAVTSEVTEQGSKDVLDVFMSKLANERTKYNKEYKPFDSAGARFDFEEYVRRYVVELNVAVDKSSVKRLGDFDLTTYGDPERFIFLESNDVIETKIAGNVASKIDIVTGKTYNYKTKSRGNGISIFVPLKDIEKVDDYVRKTYLKEDKVIKKV
jgi:hypothetical protein